MYLVLDEISSTYKFCLIIIAKNDTCNTITKLVQHGSHDKASVFVHSFKLDIERSIENGNQAINSKYSRFYIPTCIALKETY